MIAINKRFEMERDDYGWRLHEFKNGTSKQGEPITTKQTTYFPNITQICNAVIDRSCGECDSVDVIIVKLTDVCAELKSAIEKIQ